MIISLDVKVDGQVRGDTMTLKRFNDNILKRMLYEVSVMMKYQILMVLLCRFPSPNFVYRLT